MIILKFNTFSGAGIALLIASKELDNLQTTNSAQKIGVRLSGRS